MEGVRRYCRKGRGNIFGGGGGGGGGKYQQEMDKFITSVRNNRPDDGMKWWSQTESANVFIPTT